MSSKRRKKQKKKRNVFETEKVSCSNVKCIIPECYHKKVHRKVQSCMDLCAFYGGYFCVTVEEMKNVKK